MMRVLFGTLGAGAAAAIAHWIFGAPVWATYISAMLGYTNGLLAAKD